MGLPRIIRLKENAPELDCSSFYVTTGTGNTGCLVGQDLAFLTKVRTHPRGDFAPYRALFSVSCAHPQQAFWAGNF